MIAGYPYQYSCRVPASVPDPARLSRGRGSDPGATMCGPRPDWMVSSPWASRKYFSFRPLSRSGRMPAAACAVRQSA
ncbi:hypothetical protein ACFQ3Z_34135 [Streptomyces nogalater]